MDRWFPVARSEEVQPGHVFQTSLLGQEIAVWRGRSGAVNAWENRCPHRGVRLSIGDQIENELRCRYHGWRFASGSGQCTLIPSHPTQKPGAALCATRYSSTERYGYVWASLQPRDDVPSLPPEGSVAVTVTPPVEGAITTLRSVYVAASLEAVAERLLLGRVARLDAYTLVTEACDRAGVDDAAVANIDSVYWLLQPLEPCATVIHGLVGKLIPAAQRLAGLRAYNARLIEVRDAVELAR
jgi:nitrite reductase/ring-hydroxylating ferredoxin subunit